MSTMKTQFTEGICPDPTPGGNHAGLSGGYPIESDPGSAGMVSSPYTDGICPGVGSAKETSSSELGTTPTLTDVKDAPAGQVSGMSGIGMVGDHTTNQTFKTSR